MGVYIPGMEMPASCWRCEIGNAEQMDNRPCPFYSIDGEEQEKYADSRHPDCPLVPVPPHGRLIYADALYKRFYAEELTMDKPYIDYLGLVVEAPSIIPAEEGSREE